MQRHLRLHLLFLAMGIAAMVAQIVLLRRLIVAFGGNELVTGGMLAGWLGFSGTGSLIAGRVADRLRDPGNGAAAMLLTTALLIPATVAAATVIKVLLGLPAPAMVGLETAIAASMLLMAPLGLAVGASFSLACRLPATGTAQDIARVYLWDALGAGLGGLAVSALLLVHLPALAIAAAAAALLATTVLATIPLRRSVEIVALLFTAAAVLVAWRAPELEHALTGLAWRGYDPIAERESRLATLMVTDNRGERTLFADGRPLFSLPLPDTYESTALVPLLLHPDPRNVAMIEGGVSGIADQWRPHPPGRALFLRLDPLVTELERTVMPSSLADLPDWVQLEQGDGRRLLRQEVQGRCPSGCLDVLIVNAGEPDTAAADRYYTAEFFAEAARALKPGGVLAIALLSPSNVVSPETAQLLGGIEATLRSVFPEVLLLPLDRYFFVASRKKGILTDDLNLLAARLRERRIVAPFLTEQLLPALFPERIAQTQQMVAAAARTAAINTDLHPRAYFNGLLLWQRRSGGGPSLLAHAARSSAPWMAFAAVAILAVIAIAASRGRGRQRVALSAVLASAGFASMVATVALLVHYQMTEGLLVARVGLIIAAFMVGAGLGAWIAQVTDRWPRQRHRVLLLALATAAVYLPALFAVAALSFIAANAVLGMVIGFIYQRCAGLLAEGGRGIGTVAGVVQNADLWGAACGALAASAIVIPLFGLTIALALASASLLASGVVLAMAAFARNNEPQG